MWGVLTRVICLWAAADHLVWKLRTSGLGVRTTTTDEMQKGISAAVGINSANGWYSAGLDVCLCLLCCHVEPSEALWQDASPLIAAWPSSRATSPYKAIQLRLCAERRRGYGGGLRPCLYVKALRKFGLTFSPQIQFLNRCNSWPVTKITASDDWGHYTVL